MNISPTDGLYGTETLANGSRRHYGLQLVQDHPNAQSCIRVTGDAGNIDIPLHVFMMFAKALNPLSREQKGEG